MMTDATSATDTGLSGLITSLPDQIPYPGWVMLAGMIVCLIFLVFLCFCLIRLIGHGLNSLNRSAVFRAMKDDTTPGDKILIACLSGPKGSATRKQVEHALETYLPEFSFGSSFYLASAPLRLNSSEFALTKTDLTRLEKVFAASDARLIVWGDTKGSPEGNVRLCMVTPDMLKQYPIPAHFILDIFVPFADWSKGELTAIAYVAGKRLRSAMSRPGDYRPEKLNTILAAMSRILESGTVLSYQPAIELEDDFSTCALHVGEALNDAFWLKRTEEFQLQNLQRLTPQENLLRWAKAKIDLGRAICRQCESKYDPTRLQEGVKHLQEGIEASRQAQRQPMTDAALEALKRAEDLAQSRRRFSIRWSV